MISANSWFIDLRDQHLAGLIATKMAQWHRSYIAGNCDSNLVHILKLWVEKIPKRYKQDHEQEQFSRMIDISYIKVIIEFLEKSIKENQSKYPVVFCHNDLLSGNIVYSKSRNDISFIDFEYGGYNYRGFDIANHFCEYAGFECNWDDYPSIEMQKTWLSWYLKAMDVEPTEIIISDLLEEIRLFTIASHVYWGLWALVQAAHSDIDFDYMRYAVERIERLRYDLGRYQSSK